MLTIVTALIIIARSRETDRQDQFNATLTRVWRQVNQTPTATPALTPTDAPPLTLGEYPFALAPNNPVYSAADNCGMQILSGIILTEDGAPTDAFHLAIWGDYTPPQIIPTGEVAGGEPGRWTLTLDGVVERRVWIQLTADDRYFSPPTEIVLKGSDCTQNHAEITFQQIAPLNDD